MGSVAEWWQAGGLRLTGIRACKALLRHVGTHEKPSAEQDVFSPRQIKVADAILHKFW
jgi:hypothetical protein